MVLGSVKSVFKFPNKKLLIQKGNLTSLTKCGINQISEIFIVGSSERLVMYRIHDLKNILNTVHTHSHFEIDMI